MELRSYRPGDAEGLAGIFFDAVRIGARGHYSDAERAAWAPDQKPGTNWPGRLANADTVVAEQGGQLLGFMSMQSGGYLDLAFVRPEAFGQGIGFALYAMLEGRARARGVANLTTEASLVAEPFFLRQGWQVIRRQNVDIRGVLLKNALMEKRLVARAA